MEAVQSRNQDYARAIDRKIKTGLDFLVSLQEEDGSWRSDYGGPMFLLPMYAAACRICKREIPPERKKGIVRYLKNVMNQDGSIGLHTEDRGSMFTTVLSYVALRLQSVPRDDEHAAAMRKWILSNGTALGSASWGKSILAVLDLYSYDGLNPVLPELWLLPYSSPVHPAKLWCHTRQVYLPLAYLYGTRAKVEADDLIHQIRTEIYDIPYEDIDFAAHRNTVSDSDNRYPCSGLLNAANMIMNAYEKIHPGFLRKRSLKKSYDHIEYEDRTTNYIDIGPVNSVLNTMVHFFSDPDSESFRKSFDALESYITENSLGINFNGYNSTALWDTAFAVQSLKATGLMDEYMGHMDLAHGFIRKNQITEDLPDRDRYYRFSSKGGWPFSDRENGWPVTDCTAEGFTSSVYLEDFVKKPMDEDLLKDSVRLMLNYQNPDGGWSSYEKQRGGAWLEMLNPSQVFGDIMVDYSYVECTSACVQALKLARERFGGFEEQRILNAIRDGVNFIRKRQRPDGSWEGSWGVCFTYGTWFGVWGLVAGGVPVNSRETRNACGFLAGRQNRDGGWGESFKSCIERRYVRRADSLAVNTAWALLTLIRAGLADTECVLRGVRFLARRQQEDGDWPMESMTGVFNKSTLINYEHYRRYFPLWALAEFRKSRTLPFVL